MCSLLKHRDRYLNVWMQTYFVSLSLHFIVDHVFLCVSIKCHGTLLEQDISVYKLSLNLPSEYRPQHPSTDAIVVPPSAYRIQKRLFYGGLVREWIQQNSWGVREAEINGLDSPISSSLLFCFSDSPRISLCPNHEFCSIAGEKNI